MSMHYVSSSLGRNNTVERLVYDSDPMSWNHSALALERVESIRTAISGHLEFCETYRRYCEVTGFSVDHVQSELDLPRIPQLPTNVFKYIPPATLTFEDDILETKSSGTQGVASRVFRNSTTLDRLVGGMRTSYGLLGSYREDEVAVIHLGPSPEASNGIWMPYVMGTVELVYETHHCVQDGRFSVNDSLERLEGFLDSGRHVLVLGPPFLALELAEAALSRGLKIDGGERLYFVTGGGWKRLSGRAVMRANFDALLVRAFSLEHSHQVRDAFNQVELNSVLLECRDGRKHLPPWLQVIVRDLDTLEPVPFGTRGVVSFLDPTATSYPAFFVGDDFGVLEKPDCLCGCASPSLDILRRLFRSEARGCALRVEEKLKA